MLKLNSFSLSDNTKVHLSVLNNRTISVYPVDDKYEIKDEDGNIIGISYNNGEYVISKGEIITIGKTTYKINEIEKNSTSLSDKNTYNLFTFRKITTTANFIMPFLGGNRANWRWSTYFINAFIDEESFIVKLLYRFSGSTEFAEFEKLIQTFPHFVDSVDLDSYNSIYNFKIPEEFIEDTKLIMNSKYSKVSEKAKIRIMEFANNSNKTKPIGQILYKCPIRRQEMSKEIDYEIPEENELYDLFKINEETFLDSYILNNNGRTRKRIVPPSGFV